MKGQAGLVEVDLRVFIVLKLYIIDEQFSFLDRRNATENFHQNARFREILTHWAGKGHD